VVPHLLPEIGISVAISFVAYFLKSTETYVVPEKSDKAFDVIGFLLAFLLVFKTQSAYSRFWEANAHLDGMLQTTRAIAMTACGVFDWSATSEDIVVRQEARRIVRHLALNYFVILEHFQRTGPHATQILEVRDRLRFDIQQLTGENELKMLYPTVAFGADGSDSERACANPMMVMFWIHTSLGRVLKVGACPPPILAGLIQNLDQIMGHYWRMDSINKLQFPLPYEQIVKILVTIFVFLLPFMIVDGAGRLTPFVAAVVALGFFGLDAVAEVLEAPFGNDPNCIRLRQYGSRLMEDLTMIYHSRDVHLDTVFTDADDVNLMRVLEAQNLRLSESQKKINQKVTPFASVIPVQPELHGIPPSRGK